MPNTELTEFIKKAIGKVPVFSMRALQLLKLAADPAHHLTDIINIVKQDIGLTARVLKTVNSAAFIRHAEITTIDRAITQLGETIVVGLAVMEAASRQFKTDLSGYDGLPGDLWRHSLKTAIAAKKIGHFSVGTVKENMAYTGGLLHDIGKSLTSDFLQNTAQGISEQINEGKFGEYCAAEREIMGQDHAETGFLLATHWHLPPPLPQVIRFHHHPADSPEPIRPLVYTVHLADILAMMTGCGTGADTLQYRLDPKYSEYLQITEDDLPRLILEIDEEFTSLLDTFQSPA
ncbi:MAG: HDOD domain-containing protein [Proteobacteria bacterium]|nr:HDOD domain-containing protein [Pseudomonadota bacterium]MBU1687956.1 HDOD domain-containing protein [Pseudomonadota bacterium]